MEASLGNALAKAAIAWSMLATEDVSVEDRLLRVSPLLSFFKQLLKVQRRVAASPNVKAVRACRQSDEHLENFLTHSVSKASISSFSPFKSPKALSLDLNRTYRSQSTYRMETDRVNRLTRYCEGLERKAKWVTLRETKEAEHKRMLQERAKQLHEQFQLNRSFHEHTLTQQRVQRLTERKDKDESRCSTREAKLALRREELKRQQDDLHRSVADRQFEAHSFVQFSKALEEERKKREKAEKHRETKEYLTALKRSTEARKIVVEHYDPEVDLAFQLQQAVAKNQEIVKRIVGSNLLE